jgi:hypothetical protein
VLLEIDGKRMDEGKTHNRMNSIFATLEEILQTNSLQARIALKFKNSCLKRGTQLSITSFVSIRKFSQEI